MTRHNPGTCKTCNYCHAIPLHIHECRRHTPPWTTVVYDEDWCGEYSPNVEESRRLNSQMESAAIEWKRARDKALLPTQIPKAGAEPLELTTI
jgi:hypothetical protein